MKKVLIVGYGSIGKRHVNNLLKESNFKIIICTKQKNLKTHTSFLFLSLRLPFTSITFKFGR